MKFAQEDEEIRRCGGVPMAIGVQTDSPGGWMSSMRATRGTFSGFAFLSFLTKDP